MISDNTLPISDHKPLIYDGSGISIFTWNIQNQKQYQEYNENNPGDKSHETRYKLIAEKIIFELKNIVFLQEVDDVIDRNLVTGRDLLVDLLSKYYKLIIDTPKNITKVNDIETARGHYNCIFVKNNMDIFHFGDNPYVSNNHKNNLPIIHGTTEELLSDDQLNNTTRITSYHNFICHDEVLYINIHGTREYYDLQDILDFIKSIKSFSYNNIIIAGDFNKKIYNIISFLNKKYGHAYS